MLIAANVHIGDDEWVSKNADIQPVTFSDPWFVQHNREFYDEYLYYKVRGYPSDVSFNRSFGKSLLEPVARMLIEESIYNIEATSYFNRGLKRLIEQTPIDELWNTRECVGVMLSIVHTDERSKGIAAVKLEAARELDQLTGSREVIGRLINEVKKPRPQLPPPAATDAKKD